MDAKYLLTKLGPDRTAVQEVREVLELLATERERGAGTVPDFNHYSDISK